MRDNKQNLNIAVVQMSSTEDDTANLQQVAHFAEQSAEKHTDIVILPENVLCHGSNNQIKSIALTKSEWIDKLKNYSIDNSVAIVWGGIPVICDDKLRNMSLVISHNGELLAEYAKNHLFELKGVTTERDLYTPGTEKGEFVFNGWRIALSICFDLRFPQFFLEYNFPDLILCTAAFTQKTGKAHWELLCCARAVENQCYLAASNQHTLSENPFPTFGHSMIVSPWGEIETVMETGSGVISFSLEKQKIEKIREKIPVRR